MIATDVTTLVDIITMLHTNGTNIYQPNDNNGIIIIIRRIIIIIIIIAMLMQ